jgi:Zn-dependent protease
MDSADLMMRLRDGLVYLIALILSICVHEFGHAFVADKLGDPLPRAQGRVTLNPVAHIDPIGTLLIPMIQFLSPGLPLLGWGKPVRISLSARQMTRRFSLKISHMFIAAAGPGMNLVFGLVLSAVFVALFATGGMTHDRYLALVAYVIKMNVLLAFFNLIPCPPLDGGAILHGILPRDLEWISESLQKYGFIILFALLWTGLLGRMLWPADWLARQWISLLLGWIA